MQNHVLVTCLHSEMYFRSVSVNLYTSKTAEFRVSSSMIPRIRSSITDVNSLQKSSFTKVFSKVVTYNCMPPPCTSASVVNFKYQSKSWLFIKPTNCTNCSLFPTMIFTALLQIIFASSNEKLILHPIIFHMTFGLKKSSK